MAILGGHSEDVAEKLSLPAFPLGYVSDEKTIVQIYSSADVFVLPSLEDNLPNTIMEAMACGVPSVGFKVGGIPEMIDHQKMVMWPTIGMQTTWHRACIGFGGG